LKLLLDEMLPAAIARALRSEGYDVAAVQEDPDLRELSDFSLFATAQRLERAIVTENVKDFLPLDAQSQAQPQPHWGLVLTSNQSFPRHRPRFIGAMTRALRDLLDEQPGQSPVSTIHWLRISPTEEK
jgi:predicted nuclease of predicted toxin-antitoxin system